MAHFTFVSPSLSGQNVSKVTVNRKQQSPKFLLFIQTAAERSRPGRLVLLRLFLLLLWLHLSNAVASEVSVQGAFGLEALPTDAAAVGFLSSMD